MERWKTSSERIQSLGNWPCHPQHVSFPHFFIHPYEIHHTRLRHLCILHHMTRHTRCNHTILDYGTFGLWAALFAGGRIIVPAGYRWINNYWLSTNNDDHHHDENCNNDDDPIPWPDFFSNKSLWKLWHSDNTFSRSEMTTDMMMIHINPHDMMIALGDNPFFTWMNIFFEWIKLVFKRYSMFEWIIQIYRPLPGGR